MSLKAYQKTQQVTENPRETEYRLFGQVTRALMDAVGSAPTDHKLVDAIDWNRRMWSTLAADCASDDNKLPEQLRASIISLSIFVSKYSSQVIREGAELDTLIDINKTIMEGLSPKAEPALV